MISREQQVRFIGRVSVWSTMLFRSVYIRITLVWNSQNKFIAQLIDIIDVKILIGILKCKWFSYKLILTYKKQIVKREKVTCVRSLKYGIAPKGHLLFKASKKKQGKYKETVIKTQQPKQQTFNRKCTTQDSYSNESWHVT